MSFDFLQPAYSGGNAYLSTIKSTKVRYHPSRGIKQASNNERNVSNLFCAASIAFRRFSLYSRMQNVNYKNAEGFVFPFLSLMLAPKVETGIQHLRRVCWYWCSFFFGSLLCPSAEALANLCGSLG